MSWYWCFFPSFVFTMIYTPILLRLFLRDGRFIHTIKKTFNRSILINSAFHSSFDPFDGNDTLLKLCVVTEMMNTTIWKCSDVQQLCATTKSRSCCFHFYSILLVIGFNAPFVLQCRWATLPNFYGFPNFLEKC